MFFSVKTPVKILGKIYTPCVCYEVADVLKVTIDKLVAEGKAVVYEQRVFFQNGKVLEKKTVVKDNLTTKKKSKKAKKEISDEFLAETEKEVREEAHVDIPESLHDVEGF